MAYDAVGVSYHDLLAGYDFFKTHYLIDFPFVSANVFKSSGEHVFKAHIIKKMGSVNLGIIGITGLGGGELRNMVIKDWRKSLKDELNKIRSQCDIIIVLSSLNDKENQKLYKMFPELNIVITAHSKSTNSPAKIVGKTLIVQSGKRGKYFGQLDITWNGMNPWGDKSPSKQEELENKLKTITWYINEFSKQEAKNTTPVKDDRISKLKASREKLIQEITALQLESRDTAQTSYNNYKSRVLPIHPRDTPPGVQKIVGEITDSINSYNKQKQLRLKSAAHVTDKELESDTIAGYKMCSSCHEKQYIFWKNTRHASSFKTLLDRGQAYNLSCLPCHVTGGEISASSPENLKENLLLLEDDRLTVGCENCHGPAKFHAQFPEQSSPVIRISESVCTTCHTPERDNNFGYTSKLAIVRCPTTE